MPFSLCSSQRESSKRTPLTQLRMLASVSSDGMEEMRRRRNRSMNEEEMELVETKVRMIDAEVDLEYHKVFAYVTVKQLRTYPAQ